MSLADLVTIAANKSNFTRLSDYLSFCQTYLDFVEKGLQAVIVSQNETQYRFYQYKQDGHYNISRPINAALMYESRDAAKITDNFLECLHHARDLPSDDNARREIIIRGIYTIQQSIGATLDALPSGKSNTARKINGDLFERFIQLLLTEIGVECTTGTVKVPVVVDGEIAFHMSYQHDLLLYNQSELKVIGSVKTSSKDRIDKIFLDKFLYSKLTETELPHIAVFLNDVQRKSTKKENEYGVNSTFLTGHFKAFTVKLNPLDGVYYCDIRPVMQKDKLLSQRIKTIDHFFCSDVWTLLEKNGVPLQKVIIEDEPAS